MSEPGSPTPNNSSNTEDAAQRRKLRVDLRNVGEEVANRRTELENVGNQNFEHLRGRLNSISSQITHTRELQLDIGVVKELAKIVKEQAVKIDDMSLKFDLTVSFQRLKQEYSRGTGLGGRGISWTQLGRDVGVLFRGVPSYSTMLGPMDRELKVRKETVRHARIVEEVDKSREGARELSNAANSEGDQEATNARLRHLFGVITDLSQQVRDANDPAGVGIIPLLVDRVDDVQTIENFFDFSFLIKEKKTLISKDPITQLPTCIAVNDADLVSSNLQPQQSVLAVSMKDLKRLRQLLCDAESADAAASIDGETGADRLSSSAVLKVEKYPRLHRDDELYTAENVHTQADILEKRALDGLSGTQPKSQPQPQPRSNGSSSSTAAGDSGSSSKRPRTAAADHNGSSSSSSSSNRTHK